MHKLASAGEHAEEMPGHTFGQRREFSLRALTAWPGFGFHAFTQWPLKGLTSGKLSVKCQSTVSQESNEVKNAQKGSVRDMFPHLARPLLDEVTARCGPCVDTHSQHKHLSHVIGLARVQRSRNDWRNCWRLFKSHATTSVVCQQSLTLFFATKVGNT